jgi:AcrR family transcriptional regulator
MTGVDAPARGVRERLLDAAQHAIETSGWSTVTMVRIADSVGVSRQTVYNEFGTKHGLAEQLALRELGRFLDVVRARMAGESELVAGIRAACEGALEMAEQSLLVRTILGSTDGADDLDFLRLLTTESGEIVAIAGTVVRESIDELYTDVPLAGDDLDTAVEVVVRLVLSSITRPSKPARESARDIGWVVELALKGAGR